jgi:uncharacterized membrane protein
MGAGLITLAASIAGFVVLDGLWLGLVMKNFYRAQLMPIARMANGGMAPLWLPALAVYLLLGAGVAVFVVPRAATVAGAAGLGAVFGLVVYGVYDLTNYATLAQWPAIVTVADIAWGTCACAMVAAAVFAVSSR